jgi:hypothetical protein
MRSSHHNIDQFVDTQKKVRSDFTKASANYLFILTEMERDKQNAPAYLQAKLSTRIEGLIEYHNQVEHIIHRAALIELNAEVKMGLISTQVVPCFHKLLFGVNGENTPFEQDLLYINARLNSILGQ